MESIYTFSDYKTYLKYRITQEKRSRGNQKMLCEAAGLQPSFLSRVIHGALHLTPEHAAGMTKFWGLSAHEAHYFQELVNLARAGTPLLRSILKEKLEELKRQSRQVSNRVALPSIQAEQIQTFYYSSWLVAAIHVMVSIEGFRTTEAIAERLAIEPAVALGILRQLHAFEMIEERDGEWRVGHYSLHLPSGSPHQGHHQTNWKLRAIASHAARPNGLHYCNVHSISRADFLQLQEELLRFISRCNQVIHDSPAEKLACINLDYFEP